MEDFGFKLQNIKERYWFKRTTRIILIVFAIIFVILIVSKIKKIFFNNSEKIENIVLIKSQNKEIKKLPEKEGGLVIDNLNISVYDVIDNKEKSIKNPILKKTQEKIKIENDLSDINLVEQELLAEKINSINENEEMDEKIIVQDIKDKQNMSITINNNEKKSTTNVNDLEKLGNNALIRNLRRSKDEKHGIRVQIMAIKSREGLVEYWNELKNKYPNLFNDKTYYIEKVDSERVGTIYRLQIGIFSKEAVAAEFCKEYIRLTNKNKTDCIIIK